MAPCADGIDRQDGGKARGTSALSHNARDDLFYFLVSSMLVQVITFLALAPSSYLNAHSTELSGIRAGTVDGLAAARVMEELYARGAHTA